MTEIKENAAAGKASPPVIFYSRDGHTRELAGVLSRTFGGHLLEVQDRRSRKTMLFAALSAALGLRTEIDPPTMALKESKMVFIGCPNWAGRMPPAARTLVKTLELKGVDVVLFATCGGDEKHGGHVLTDMQKLVNERGGKVVGRIFKSAREPEEVFNKRLSELEKALSSLSLA